MREIKLRAWDKFKKCFIPAEVWAICQTDFKAFSVMLKDWEDYREGEYFYEYTQELSEYTGLKDKNGKEIYEGDIVEFIGGTCSYLQNGLYVDQRYKIGDKMIVQKLLSGFTLCGLNMYECDIPNRVGKVDNYTFWNHSSSLKVIGNIYESPELLK